MGLSDDRILYVDDEIEARNAFAAAATELGFRVDTAEGGGDALTQASRNHYAVIATDLRMPSLNGLALIQLLRPRWPETSYLVFSGAAHLDLPTQSNGEPLVDDVVTKPWSLDELSMILTRAIERYRERTTTLSALAAVAKPLLLIGDPEPTEQLRELTATAHASVSAATVEDAIEILQTTGVGAAVLAIGSTGCSVTRIRRLRAESNELPIVVVGEREDEAVVARAIHAGAQEYVVLQRLNDYGLNRAVHYAIEKRQTERRLNFLANHDPVTGLANRSLFRERLELAIRRAQRRYTGVAVLLLDLDRFKTVNDSLGHEIGDRLIRVVATRVSRNVREVDTVARLGGDEFAVLIEDVTSDSEARATAQRILEALVPPARLSNYEIVATGSIGIAMFPEHGETASEILRKADRAMYRAKTAGRDGYQLHNLDDEESRSGVLERLRFESGLRHALERDEYEIFYQPQMSFDRTRLLGVEALLRWNHPRVGLVAPNQFIPFLESTGLISGVGEWVLETACREVASWQTRGFPNLKLSVNLSARQFEGPELVDTVERVLLETGFTPERLELEITESLLMTDIERTRGLLDRLKAIGVRIAIDDFGTGYSSLSYLTKFPLDSLKIDRSFVHDIETDADDRAVAEAVIGLGHSLRLDVVAEGVETEAQLALLSGCDGFQGYLISPPEPSERVLNLMTQFTAASPRVPPP